MDASKIASRIVVSESKGTLSFNGSSWSVRWATAWPANMGFEGGKQLDRELKDKVMYVAADIDSFRSTGKGGDFEDVKPAGYMAIHSNLIGEVWFRARLEDKALGAFLDYMKSRGYRVK